MQVEAQEKEQQGFAKLSKWEDLRKNLPPEHKLSPRAMIPHKSRNYWEILDLSFELKLAEYLLPLVNDAIKKCAPK